MNKVPASVVRDFCGRMLDLAQLKKRRKKKDVSIDGQSIGVTEYCCIDCWEKR